MEGVRGEVRVDLLSCSVFLCKDAKVGEWGCPLFVFRARGGGVYSHRAGFVSLELDSRGGGGGVFVCGGYGNGSFAGVGGGGGGGIGGIFEFWCV